MNRDFDTNSPTYGLFPGSFDPFTIGHFELLSRALRLVNRVTVLIAINPDKVNNYNLSDRKGHIETLMDLYLDTQDRARCDVQYLPIGELTVRWAAENGVTHMLRGIRNTNDLLYEEGIRGFNEQLVDTIQTIYFALPDRMARISSSLVRGLVGTNGWEDLLFKQRLCFPTTIMMLKHDYEEKRKKAVGPAYAT